MKFSIFPDCVSIAGKPVYHAFVDYIHQNTHHEIVEYSLHADCAVIWSVLWHGRMTPFQEIYQHYINQGKPVIILEVGALARNHTWRVAVDHIDNTGYYGTDLPLDIGRPSKLNVKLEDWQDNTHGHILVCGQHDRSELWKNMPPQSEWIQKIVQQVGLQYNNKIIVRIHPRCPIPDLQDKNVEISYPRKIPGTYDDFDFYELLTDCRRLITHTSNTGLQALLKGIPVESSSNSLYHGVDCTNRQEWLLKIAHTEWTVEEIAKGVPFRRIENYCLSKLQRLPLNHSPTNS